MRKARNAALYAAVKQRHTALAVTSASGTKDVPAKGSATASLELITALFLPLLFESFPLGFPPHGNLWRLSLNLMSQIILLSLTSDSLKLLARWFHWRWC
jgi:hypothetical protein